jgi:hypothetical protein
MVKLGVERADDLAASIAADLLALFVPEDRGRVPVLILSPQSQNGQRRTTRAGPAPVKYHQLEDVF